MALRAVEFETPDVEKGELRWNDLTPREKANIASALESKRHLPEFKWIKVGDLFVDEAYQRPVSTERVWSIVKEFDWRLFQPLWVGDRRGKLYIVDGRHRFSAAMIFGKTLMPEVPCEIRRTASVEEEARIFVDLQDRRRRLSSWQKFQAKLLYGDTAAHDIQKIVVKNGFKIQDPSKFTAGRTEDAVISAVGALEAIYRSGGRKLLDSTLYVLMKAWEGASATTSVWMLLATARTIQTSVNLDDNRLARILGKKDPWGLIERGQRFGHSNGISQSEALADVMKRLCASD